MAPLRATYRLQLGGQLHFAAAARLIPYLSKLGVSHLYLSPILQARAGSAHGYDTIDPGRVSRELGGEEGFRALAGAASRAGMGIILDVVPNHMAADPANRLWADPGSRRRFFDIDPATGRHRRFFDIDGLAALRQEDPEVFATTHGKVLQLLADGLIDGLRVDHPDGLADPAGYLRALRAAGARRIWVEKILHPSERLRDWPVMGTVGYELLSDLTALWIDPAGEPRLSELHSELTGERRSFAEVAHEAQIEQARTALAPEVARLHRLTVQWTAAGPAPGGRVAQAELDGADLPDGSGGTEGSPLPLAAIAEALARLPVYRTYVEPWSGLVEPADRAAIEAAEMDARLAGALLLEEDAAPDELARRFQQTSPAIAAKGIEDTAFYRHLRLLALNEVGGDPDRFFLALADFHRRVAERGARFPFALQATQTHDCKRSADVRARIGALSGMAEQWRQAVLRWRALAAPLREGRAPDPAEEYLIMQTLVGSWPIEPDRLCAYLVKALREAKRNTSWVRPDPAWEQGVTSFARRLVRHRPFLDAFEPFAARVAEAGRAAALGQLLLKLTVPGVPDIYQGDELEALWLVDPDNRRPVDWERRRLALDSLAAGSASEDYGEDKLMLIQRALQLRARRPRTFAGGSYLPLDAGPAVCAFARGGEAIAIAPIRNDGRDGELLLPDLLQGRWRDVLTGAQRRLGGTTPVGGLLAEHGVALLERVG